MKIQALLILITFLTPAVIILVSLFWICPKCRTIVFRDQLGGKRFMVNEMAICEDCQKKRIASYD